MDVITVKEIMMPVEEYPSIAEDATIYDAFMKLEEAMHGPERPNREHRSLIVVNKEGLVIGKLTYFDLLKSLEPKYSNLGDTQNVSRFGVSSEFMTFVRKHFGLWEGSFQELCRKALHFHVKEAVPEAAPSLFIDENATVADAVHQLVLEQEMSLLVTRENEVVGIVRLIDAFDTVWDGIKQCRV